MRGFLANGHDTRGDLARYLLYRPHGRLLIALLLHKTSSAVALAVASPSDPPQGARGCQGPMAAAAACAPAPAPATAEAAVTTVFVVGFKRSVLEVEGHLRVDVHIARPLLGRLPGLALQARRD